MTRYTTATKTVFQTTKKLGEGGEGAVYDLAGHPDLVAKIYHPQRLNAALVAKVVAMTQNPPEDATRVPLRHVSIAWPIDALYSGTQFVGYTMPKLKKSDDLYDLLQPQQRAKEHGSLNHRHLYRTAHNLAIALDAIHRKGYVVGDVNFKNALFNDDALITMVDCDSMQVTDAKGVVHRCLVGVPEYTSPELQGADFARVNRTADHDAFGLAVLIFQLLMQGFHPFAGVPRPGAPDVEQAHIYCIKNNIFPYLEHQPFTPPPAAPSLLCLPVLVRHLFERAFVRDPHKPAPRPTPKEWASVLAMVESRLAPCPNDPSHWYPTDGFCVICEVDYNVGRRTRTAPKPSATIQQQAPLSQPSISTTSALRPAAVSPVQAATVAPAARPASPPAASPTPQAPKPVPRPAQPTPVRQPAPANPGAVTPLVAPTPPPSRPAPRVVPPVQPPAAPLWPQITQYLRAHQATAIPVAVIVGALLFAAIAANGSNTPATAVTAEPTVAESNPTPLATTAPDTARPSVTSVPLSASVACSAESVVAAAWPMLPRALQRSMVNQKFPATLRSYSGTVLTVDPKQLLPESTPAAVAGMTCTNGAITKSNPLQPAAAAITSPGLVCAGNGCRDEGRLPVAHEYQLVLINTRTKNNRAIDSSKELVHQFFDRVPNRKINAVLVAAPADAVSELSQSLIRPFVRTPLVSVTVGNPTWPEGTNTTNARVFVKKNTQWYEPGTGLRVATADLESPVTQVIRTIPAAALRTLRWQDGSPLTAEAYVAGWQDNTAATDPLLADVTALATGELQLTYVPGLPADVAAQVAPVPLPAGAAAGGLADSTSKWTITAPTRTTYAVNHATDNRLSFTLSMVTSVEAVLSHIAAQTDDMVIVDATLAPELLVQDASNIPEEYSVYLVPTGSVWVLEQ